VATAAVGSSDRPDDLPGKVVAALDRISRGVRAHRQAVATRTGLSPLQADLMRTLAEGTPPEAQPSSLATELGVNQSTASDALSALARKRLIRSRPTPGDRRSSTYTLTAKGATVAGELGHADAVLRDTVAALSNADQEHALSTVVELMSAMASTGLLRAARTCPTCHFFESTPAPRCTLLQAPLPAADIRVNCPEHRRTA